MNNCIDLTGMKFGKLTIKKRVDNYISPKGRIKARWEAECDCGNIVYSTTANIKSGRCQCWDCAHKATGAAKRKNIEGQTFGYLTVLSIRRTFSKSGKQRTYCYCECKCGKRLDVLMDTLMSPGLHSCGCARKEIANKLSKNIDGMKFGRLTVLKELKEYTPRRVLCLCDCGNEIVVIKTDLMSYHTQSCGCLQMERITEANSNRPIVSSKEVLIKNYLEDNNISYISQYYCDDCRDVMPLPFDFALLLINKFILVEYDGKQHFEPIDFFGGVEGFELRKKHDEIKNKYCHDNKIQLVRIPYTMDDESIINLLNQIIQP